MDTINSRIEFLIKDLEITKTSFAEQLHVSVAFISGLCSGVKNPSDRTISDICRVFGVSEAYESTRKRGIAAALDMPPEFWDNILEYAKKITGSK